MISVRELLKKAVGKLAEAGNSNTTILDAELLLIHVLNQSGMKFDRLKLLTQQDCLIDEHMASGYMDLIAERSKGKPVQYIVNKQEFMGLELYVEQGVLIPRADTEIIVEKVIELAKEIEMPNIIDMCTGSGAIAVSLAVNIPSARLWAVDISGNALDCSQANVKRFGLEKRVNVIKSDLFECIREEGLEGNVDIIVSNPPYISTDVINSLDINVRDYEPHLALDGGKDGLVYYKRIVKDAACFLKANGKLVFEIGYDQGIAVMKLMEESGCYSGLKIEKDLAGFDRCVWGCRY